MSEEPEQKEPTFEEMEASLTPAQRRKAAAVASQAERDQKRMQDRRVKVIMINPFDFMGLLTKGLEFRRYTKIVKGVPDDAQMLALSADTNRHGIMMVIWSSTYPPVKVGEMPPVELLEIQTELRGATKKSAPKRKKK